ncbi:MAG: CrcB family protein [Chloroflexi bacterium]|nr:CrcB family protein [Chloroflexota bacterium]
MTLVFVALGGAVGAAVRHLVDGAVANLVRSSLPWGTLVVNISGSFVAGILYAAAIERAVLPVDIRAPLMIGFLGAYTTFSTVMLDSWRLAESGSLAVAMTNLARSALLGIIAVGLGLAFGRSL